MATERRQHPAVRSKNAAGSPAVPGRAVGTRKLRTSATVEPSTRRRSAPTADKARPVAMRRRRGYKAPMRIPLAHSSRRLHVVLVAMAIALSLCAGRLLQLQGFDSSAYAARSEGQLTRTLPLLPARGDITDRNGVVMASTEAAVAVTADPLLTSKKAAETASIVARHLGMDEGTLIGLLTKPNARFVYLKKKVPALTYSKLAVELSKNKLPGIFRESNPIRSYPGGSVGASVIGFVGADGKGQAGLEYALDQELAGVEGKDVYQSAPNGSKIPLGTSELTPAQNGLNYQTTLDSELQWMAERRLAQQVAKSKADSGFAITIDVQTGQLLALANAPTVDASDPGAAPAKDRGNRAVSDPYEPGSVQKILTAAAILDSGTATVESKVKIPGRLASGGGYLKDYFRHGELHFNMRGVIAYSSNMGTVLLTRQMPKAQLHRYLTSFGLGATTGVGLPGESIGILPPADMTDSQRDQIAFGQALAVTGVQEAAALAALVNGGVYHSPTVIKGATTSDGKAVAVTQAPSRRVISEESSADVRDLMRAVVDTPNGMKNLQLAGYQSGGKTGTAQRADTECRCYKGYVTSFVGFAPLNDPKLLTYVVVSNPRRGDTGSSVAAPVYRDIMQFALPRYSVPPNGKQTKAKPWEW